LTISSRTWWVSVAVQCVGSSLASTAVKMVISPAGRMVCSLWFIGATCFECLDSKFYFINELMCKLRALGCSFYWVYCFHCFPWSSSLKLLPTSFCWLGLSVDSLEGCCLGLLAGV
jgi:hypothetical protein